jgi:hypothetical protein
MADEGSEFDAPADVMTRGQQSISCLVLHGLGGGPYELQPLIAALENAGLVVAGADGVKVSSAAHNAAGLAGESPVVGIDCLPT